MATADYNLLLERIVMLEPDLLADKSLDTLSDLSVIAGDGQPLVEDLAGEEWGCRRCGRAEDTYHPWHLEHMPGCNDGNRMRAEAKRERIEDTCKALAYA